MSADPPPLPGSSRLQYLRLTRFDTCTAEGRAAERYRLAAWGALANICPRAAGMVLMVITVHWIAPYLGAERFGVWATFASLAAMLSFLDLGVGNALINRVAHTSAAGDAEALRRVVAGGVGWLALIGAVAAGVLAVAAVAIPWGALFKLDRAADALEARDAALAFSGLFGLHLLSSGLLKVLIGQQRSYEAHLISVIGTLVACVALWCASSQRSGIAGLLLAGFGVQAITGLAVLPLLMSRGLLQLSRVCGGMRQERSGLLTTGLLFLVLQIGTMIGWGCDSLLLAGLAGAEQVAAFAIAQRLYQFASQPVAVMNAPLWAAYADAQVRKDNDFLRRTFCLSAQISVGGAAALALALLLLGPWVIPYWTQGTIMVPWTLLALLGTWTIIEAGGSALGAYLNGVGIVREQVVVVLSFCAVALPLKVFAVVQAGASGLVAATIVSYLVTTVALYATVFRRRVLQPMEAPVT